MMQRSTEHQDSWIITNSGLQKVGATLGIVVMLATVFTSIMTTEFTVRQKADQKQLDSLVAEVVLRRVVVDNALDQLVKGQALLLIGQKENAARLTAIFCAGKAAGCK